MELHAMDPYIQCLPGIGEYMLWGLHRVILPYSLLKNQTLYIPYFSLVVSMSLTFPTISLQNLP